MLEHLRDPRKAIEEMRRVLRPGGLIGLRGSMLSGHVWYPVEPVVDEAFHVWLKVWRHNGGDPDMGLKQPTLLSEAEFEVLSSSASYDADFHEGMGWSIGPLILQSSFVKAAAEQGWDDHHTLRRNHDGVVRWSQQPSAVWYLAWAEVVAHRP